LGESLAMLEIAVEQLRSDPSITLLACSRWSATTPVGGPPGQGEFLNGAARIHTTLSPLQLLERLQAIENQAGRQRTVRWNERTLDADLLLYGDRTIRTSSLEVPHPRMAFRRFVLETAAEAAPRMIHPETGWTVDQLLQHLNQSANYLAIAHDDPAAALAQQAADQSDATVLRMPDLLSAFQSSDVEATLHEQLDRLTQSFRQVVSNDQPLISDGWSGQWLAAGRALLEGQALVAWESKWKLFSPAFTTPRLLVIRPVDLASPSVVWQRYQEELSRLLNSGGVGPQFHLTGRPPEEWPTEVFAAVQAMQ